MRTHAALLWLLGVVLVGLSFSVTGDATRFLVAVTADGLFLASAWAAWIAGRGTR